MAITNAFHSEFMELRPKLLRYLIARTRSEADANDILQEVWLKLEACNTDDITYMGAYMFRTADNCLRDRIRSRQRRTQRDTVWSDTQCSGGVNHDPIDPHRLLISREELAYIEQALDELPARTAYIFRAFRLEGQKQKNLADELGISLSAVEKHLQRAYAAVISARQKYNDDAEKE